MATQLLSSGYISSRRLWRMVKPMCEEIEDENGVLIIDDSVGAKPYTDCNDLICWHFDHTVNRSGVSGKRSCGFGNGYRFQFLNGSKESFKTTGEAVPDHLLTSTNDHIKVKVYCIQTAAVEYLQAVCLSKNFLLTNFRLPFECRIYNMDEPL